MSDLIIDTMSEKDIDPVLSIEQASFKHPWSRISFLNELSNKFSHSFVLKLENSFETYQIIAYLCFRLFTDEIHILKIAVNPEQRRKGIAFKFLKHCLGTFCGQKIKSATLDVRQSNTAGIGLYKKIGFDIKAQIPNYYSDTREDVILMRKNFLKEV
ncbi:MAG: ribosomal protein S18-alanine N-acetyltransferase [Desulfobacteraceae bacterium]|nr:ribosomal protein S18-alanine N-acetyltransferase [Desulfobacteraceae bacterium]MBC2757081.1 ribosomal protein S18-alanine N-acetyltransferase [Desulfobacteraceae bacterium]MBC2763702.1 ribosomal protein S18-alanine N-acetyltransferase [ANME-2 cluster archaeon]